MRVKTSSIVFNAQADHYLNDYVLGALLSKMDPSYLTASADPHVSSSQLRIWGYSAMEAPLFELRDARP